MDTRTQMIVPLRLNRSETTLANFSYRGIARLKPGVTMAQANADVARMIQIEFSTFPPPEGFSIDIFQEARMTPNLRPLKQDVVGNVGSVLWVLMGTIGLVLLIACANVANLLLVRADGRQHELTIRAALGAGQGRIARELLAESVVLSLGGGLLGVGVAYAAIRLLLWLQPSGLPRLRDISIDGPVLLFTLAVSLVAGVLFGLVPAFKYARPQLGMSLRAGGRSLSLSRERHRTRGLLVVVQVALALVLLVGSGTHDTHLPGAAKRPSRIRGPGRRSDRARVGAGRAGGSDPRAAGDFGEVAGAAWGGVSRCLKFGDAGFGPRGESYLCGGPRLSGRQDAALAKVSIYWSRLFQDTGLGARGRARPGMD